MLNSLRNLGLLSVSVVVIDLPAFANIAFTFVRITTYLCARSRIFVNEIV
jgi:hypothetical protein